MLFSHMKDVMAQSASDGIEATVRAAFITTMIV
jgi:hypothetical protein